MKAVMILSLAQFMGIEHHGAQAQDTLVFELQGVVYDQDLLTPFAGATVEVWGTDGTNFSAKSDSLGSFVFAANGRQRFVNANTTYAIRIAARDHLVVNDQISTVGITKSTTFVKEYFLHTAGVIIDETPVIYFDQHSALIHGEGQATADDVVLMLNENPNLVVELHGHCDVVEDTSLALARGEAVKHYLVKKGIDPERLIAIGSGTRALLAPSIPKTGLDGLTELERQKATAPNRRVDFAVVSFHYHK